MFISAGSAKGKKIKAPSAKDIRPTSQMIKEALFDILGPSVEETDFLDLFAGFGTVGIEALSRGAASVLFTDRNKYALSVLRENLQLSGFEKQAKILWGDALRNLTKVRGQFDFVFVDPPYDYGFYDEILSAVAARKLLKPGAAVIVEHYHKTKFSGAPLIRAREEKYGQTAMTFFREKLP